jgi:glycosyltransferase involved in cell wall biosynthesis
MASEPEAETGQPELPSVCVVTHPLSAAGENATRTLLEILAAVTTVSLVTVDLPATSQIRDRHEVVELSAQSAGESVPTAAVRFLRNQLRMAATIRRREESVVLFFGATSYLLPILVARLAGKTVLVEPRGDVPLTLRVSWERRMPAPLARLLAGAVWTLERAGYHVADGIVTYTPAMAAQLGVDDFEEKLYPDGARYVDTDTFSVQTPLAERDRVVGFVGRLDEEKNVRALAAAARKLPEGVTVRFVGDGPLRRDLEATAPADDSVEFTGWVDHDDVPAALNAMQLLVLPSQPTEGLPTTILESLACGTPVVATPVSGVPDVVRDGETGFLLDSSDPDALATAIETALEADLAAVSRRGRELIEASYSFEAATERYRAMLTSVATHST